MIGVLDYGVGNLGSISNMLKRVGADSRLLAPIRIPGEEARDSMRLVTQAAEVLGTVYDGRRVKMMFIDGTGIGGPIVDRLKQLGHTNVMEVQFGAQAPDRKYANMRAFMWGKMRDWLDKRRAVALDNDTTFTLSFGDSVASVEARFEATLQRTIEHCRERAGLGWLELPLAPRAP